MTSTRRRHDKERTGKDSRKHEKSNNGTGKRRGSSTGERKKTLNGWVEIYPGVYVEQEEVTEARRHLPKVELWTPVSFKRIDHAQKTCNYFRVLDQIEHEKRRSSDWGVS